jgi:hypothetical protein
MGRGVEMRMKSSDELEATTIKMHANPVIPGFATNSTLMPKSDASDYGASPFSHSCLTLLKVSSIWNERHLP